MTLVQNETTRFAPALAARLKAADNRLCVGVDPHLQTLPPFFAAQRESQGPEIFLNRFSDALIEGVAGHASVLKFQSAFYEAHGPAGVSALAASMRRAKQARFFNILDAKRGDIASTMEAYGMAAFDALDADVLTVTPYLGFDVLSPLERWLKSGRGVYVVWVTSNPTGAAVQAQSVQTANGSVTLSEYLLEYILRGADQAGFSDALGFVLGITRLADVPQSLLERVTPYPLLLPGIGPQGASLDESVKALLRRSPASLVTMSRAICGFGDTKQVDALQKLRSWSEYRDYVAERAAAAAKALTV